jgi:pyridoxamine 5'-phosphate oxidase family protein
MFSDKELVYLKSQKLGRIATVSEDLQVDVAPVGYDFDGEYFYIGGRNPCKTLKFKNIQTNSKIAFVVDDLESFNPYKPRGVKVHGLADVVVRKGYVGEGTYIRIKPVMIWSWGIEAETIQGDKAVVRKGAAGMAFEDRETLKF